MERPEEVSHSFTASRGMNLILSGWTLAVWEQFNQCLGEGLHGYVYSFNSIYEGPTMGRKAEVLGASRMPKKEKEGRPDSQGSWGCKWTSARGARRASSLSTFSPKALKLGAVESYILKSTS